MKTGRTTILILLLPFLTHAQVAVRGIVTEQNSGNKPLAGVQIKALGSTPEMSDQKGLFSLSFPAKKAGDRIVVSEISRAGFELVNKDMLSNWIIPGDPSQRSKIVMCPEGLIAQNTMKYYDISLAGLTKGYEEKIKALQEQKARAEIDARTFGEQAKQLAEQYEKQQNKLEELAEKFARENFDDCSAVHREAFEAFKTGDIAKAITILESVNSAEEIARAQVQREKGKTMERTGKQMQAESDSIISQNISKLLFQADLYRSQFRFKDAEKAYETALNADTTNDDNIYLYVAYLLDMFMTEDAFRWNKTALDQSRHDVKRAHGLVNMGFIYSYMKRFPEAGDAFIKAVEMYRVLADSNRLYRNQLSYGLGNLGGFYYETNQYDNSLKCHLEEVAIRRELAREDPAANNAELARNLENLALTQFIMNQHEEAKANYLEALGIFRELRKEEPGRHGFGIAWALMGLGKLSEPDTSEIYYREAAELVGDLMEKDYQQYSPFMARLLSAYGDMKRGQRNYAEARDIYGQALQITVNLMLTNPIEHNYIHAMVLTNMASVEEDLNDFKQSQAHYAKAHEIWSELVKDNPSVYRKDMAIMLSNSAFLNFRMKDYGKADSNYREAISLLREELKTNPLEASGILAHSLMAYSLFLYEIQDPAKALPVFTETMQRYEAMAMEQPERYRRYAAHLYGNYSFRQIKGGQYAQAEQSARRGLELDSTETWIYTNLALALLFQDKFKEAKNIYMDLKDKPYGDGGTFGEAFLRDFDELEALGIKHGDMKKIKALLK